MILVKEKKHPIESPDSTTSPNIPNVDLERSNISSMPNVNFNNDSKVLNSNTPSNTVNNKFSPKNKSTNSNKTKDEKAFFYYPLYTDPFSLSFLNYSFFKSSFNYDPDAVLQSNEYIQFEKMQNNFYSNLDQIQSFSLGTDKKDDNKTSNIDNNETSKNTSNNTSSNNTSSNNTSSNNTSSNNTSSNKNNNKNDNIYFHGIDIEDEDPKKAHRPPVCKPQ
ncbi:expressed protein [Dictyostelium purpureum]|uniref:Expressed protein n=1 Tax=Dictyostelium purpureum TaxID=5786 RepID=F0ZE35_DICPU|nr:uncharacterized protein DICPUDRAFT_91554 [Dictyostelium purpureum]EGC37818.1 expressed protein [Dictyostelium purpureum]|eukprot:XP_003285663.1 expressed protein [Dictyostelium purpureum]